MFGQVWLHQRQAGRCVTNVTSSLALTCPAQACRGSPQRQGRDSSLPAHSPTCRLHLPSPHGHSWPDSCTGWMTVLKLCLDLDFTDPQLLLVPLSCAQADLVPTNKETPTQSFLGIQTITLLIAWWLSWLHYTNADTAPSRQHRDPKSFSGMGSAQCHLFCRAGGASIRWAGWSFCFRIKILSWFLCSLH